jgi:hypothetical protein
MGEVAVTVQEMARIEATRCLEEVVRVDRSGVPPADGLYEDALADATAAFQRLLAVGERRRQKARLSAIARSRRAAA